MHYYSIKSKTGDTQMCPSMFLVTIVPGCFLLPIECHCLHLAMTYIETPEKNTPPKGTNWLLTKADDWICCLCNLSLSLRIYFKPDPMFPLEEFILVNINRILVANLHWFPSFPFPLWCLPLIRSQVIAGGWRVWWTMIFRIPGFFGGQSVLKLDIDNYWMICEHAKR